ncbi:hypothetical protein H6A65_13930 [Mediterraneibacter glycyrrhizinilyticus]|uniref:hypothetical protein n=1 Tax=Mediterraneibacter glycyrrhizinilyticus TaxID=342942 RepID=UPI00195F64D0|nr:hypothetical protein [Mediterraneibacter glycyrrhizinilyticus]MBM6752576.1 hypothetical protein [Mediterraneibacter glycyrrhizinilyticus]
MEKNYSTMTQEELEKALAEIVKKNYEKGIVLLDRNYDIAHLRLKNIAFLKGIEGMDDIIAIIRSMQHKLNLKKYCKGMADNTPLIHPVENEKAWKEPVYDGFVSREEFINRTGIFVTSEYFRYIYDSEWTDKAKKAGTTVDEFIDNYENKCLELAEVPLQGTFKYIVMDDYISGIGDYEDPNIWEIVNCLALVHEREYESKWTTIEAYQKVLDDINKNLKKDAMNFRLALLEPTTEIPS